jgi:phosphoribosyl 1,2-cyclic phosphodiesterase
MQLLVLGSSSSGNCYLLTNGNETLVIEAGVSFMEVKKALSFNISTIVGCIVSHEHQDHAKYFNEYLAAGITVYASIGTVSALKNVNPINEPVTFLHGKKINIGNFEVMPFDIIHDAAQPYGFIIRHPECGKILFITDTYYCDYTFKGLNHFIVEANYSKQCLDKAIEEGITSPSQRSRIETSHMSLQTCKELLNANDLSQVQNIVLIHLSSGNSNSDQFKQEIEASTGKQTTIAAKGVTVNFSLNDF